MYVISNGYKVKYITLHYQWSNDIVLIAIRRPNLSFAVQIPYKPKREPRCRLLQRGSCEV